MDEACPIPCCSLFLILTVSSQICMSSEMPSLTTLSSSSPIMLLTPHSILLHNTYNYLRYLLTKPSPRIECKALFCTLLYGQSLDNFSNTVGAQSKMFEHTKLLWRLSTGIANSVGVFLFLQIKNISSRPFLVRVSNLCIPLQLMRKNEQRLPLEILRKISFTF